MIHAGVVVFVCVLATVYSVVTRDHSSNIWIVYGSAIAFAAGRAGAAVAQAARHTDQPPVPVSVPPAAV